MGCQTVLAKARPEARSSAWRDPAESAPYGRGRERKCGCESTRVRLGKSAERCSSVPCRGRPRACSGPSRVRAPDRAAPSGARATPGSSPASSAPCSSGPAALMTPCALGLALLSSRPLRPRILAVAAGLVRCGLAPTHLASASVIANCCPLSPSPTSAVLLLDPTYGGTLRCPCLLVYVNRMS